MERHFEYSITNRRYAVDANGLPLNLNKKEEKNGIYMWTWLEPDGQWRAQCWVPKALRFLTNGRRNFTIAKFDGNDERPAAYVAMKFKEDLENNLLLFTEGLFELPCIPTSWSTGSGEIVGEIELPHYTTSNDSDDDPNYVTPSPRTTNKLSTQQAIFQIVQELGVKFKNSRKVATVFRSRINDINPQNDVYRLEVARKVVDEYIQNYPKDVV